MRIPLDDKERSFNVLATPLIALDIELVEGDMRSGDQNFFDEWIDSLEHGEIEHFGAMLIQIGH